MLSFRLKRTIKLGAKSLWMHRMRSILTMLGIVFGVCSVIAMLAIGEGASQEAQAQIARLGSTNIIIESVKPTQDQMDGEDSDSFIQYGLTYEDAERFYTTIPHIDVVVPARKLSQDARYRNHRASIEVIGTVPWYTQVSPIRVQQGRFLTSNDLHHKKGICVVSETLIADLFGYDDPMNQDVKISGDYYRVVGVVSETGPMRTHDGASAGLTEGAKSGGKGKIYLPLTAIKSRFGDTTLQLNSGGRSVEKVELQEITVKVETTEQVLGTRAILENLLARFHKKKDYQVTVPLELLRQAERTKRIFSIVLGSIAAISLLVGGIGIMNIMLATVSERTREIGIRRALGAKQRDIIIQFLSETILLSSTGGVVGIVLGAIIPYTVTLFFGLPTVVTTTSLVLSFGISALIGITFGLYPAYRAATLDPIESLRHE